MPAAGKVHKQKSAPQPRVLVVDDEPNLVEVIGEVVGRGMGCRVVFAASLAQARKILASQTIELLVADVNLPDGDGTSLLPALREHQPNASAIVITGSPSVDGAISAIRGGAVDFVPKPFTHAHLVDRVKKALERQALVARQEKRFGKLREAVRRLNESRRIISKKVDLLCNDLVSAYGELSRQLDGVRTQEGFRKYVANAKDLEQLLCHAMDWLLRQVGYSNVAVWLAAEDGEFQLGAYMKYTVPGEQMLTDALKRVLLPRTSRDGLVRCKGEDLADKLTPQEMHFLKGQDVVAVNCTYLGESLAALVFFRDAKTPFTGDDESLLKQVSPIFAVTLASVVRGTEDDADHPDNADAERGNGEDGNPFFDGSEGQGGGGKGEGKSGGQGDKDNNKKKPKEKKDAADWWKRGEDPPF
jgi:FixJ family two-component response regulator